MDALEKLFEETNRTALCKFEDQDFEDIGRVHDWRNYVPKEIIEVWGSLTDRERKLIFIICEPIADAEYWD